MKYYLLLSSMKYYLFLLLSFFIFYNIMNCNVFENFLFQNLENFQDLFILDIDNPYHLSNGYSQELPVNNDQINAEEFETFIIFFGIVTCVVCIFGYTSLAEYFTGNWYFYQTY